MEFLSQIFLGNLILDWLAALGVFLVIFLGVGVLGRWAIRRAVRNKKLAAKIDFNDLVEQLIQRTRLGVVFLVAVYAASFSLAIPDVLEKILRFLAVVAAVLQCVFWGLALLDEWVQRRIRSDPQAQAANATTMAAASLVIKIALWTIAILLVLQNATGMRLDALVTALGIGGVAVALAVQNILGDLFSSVSIALDKPFILGDTIAVDGLTGTVEAIGLKSTRLRSVTGEQLVFANSDLLKGRIRNYQRMQRRQALLVLNAAFDTPVETLERIPGILKQIIEGQEQVTFVRAHFKQIGDYSLLFECVYYVEVSDFQYYMDILQAVNLEIMRRFEAEGIQLVQPCLENRGRTSAES